MSVEQLSTEQVRQILVDHRPASDGCTCGDIYPDEPFDGHLSALILNAIEASATLHDFEQMDALPVGSVVMEGDSGEPQPWLNIQVMPGVFHRFPDGWYVVAGHGVRDLGEVSLPVTVLWKPSIRGAEVGAKPCDCDMWDGKHRWHCASLFRGDESGADS